LKKVLVLIVILAMALILVTACNGDDAGGAGAQGDGEQINLEFTFWGSPYERTAVEAMMAAFEDLHPNVSILPTHVPSDYDVVIRTRIAAGDAPDIGYLTGPTIYDWHEDGIIYDLSDRISADPDFHIEDFIAPCFYISRDGSIVGFNSAMEKFFIAYNIDMFEAAGLPPPPKTVGEAWSWDEMLEVAKTLTVDRNGNNAHSPDFDSDNIATFGMNIGPWWANWMNFVKSAGGDIVDETGYRFTLADSPAVDVIQMVADTIHVHHVNPTPAQREVVPAPSIALLTEQVAMVVDGQWALLDLGIAATEDGLNFGVAVLPYVGTYVSTFIGGGTVIFADSPNIDMAFELLKFTSLPSAYLPIFRDGLWMPLLREWYTDDDLFAQWAGPNNPARPPGYDTVFRDPLLMDGIVLPVMEYYIRNLHEVMSIVNPALDRVWLGEVTAEVALNEIRDDVEAILIGRYPGGQWP